MIMHISDQIERDDLSSEHYHAPGEKPRVAPRSIYGKPSPKTGIPLGSRHKWGWNSACEYCGLNRIEAMTRELSLHNA